MSLQLILGGAGSGKSTYGLQKIIALSRSEQNERFYVIVPEQFTMQTQKELVSIHPDGGIMNIDVLSFERLAYRVFEEVGGGLHPVLEEIGKTFVLERVIQKLAKQLVIFGGSAKKPGTVAEIKSLISEFMQYMIDPSELRTWADKEKVLLSYKLSDIQKIYEGFLDFTRDRYTLSENVLEVLSERISMSEKIKGATVLLDGFTGFTPIQNEVVKSLLLLCKKVYITAAIDDKEDPFVPGSAHKLFAMTKSMIHKLLGVCKEEHISIEDAVILNGGRHSRFRQAPALGFLEAQLFRYSNVRYKKKQSEIQCFAAKDPRQELYLAAAQIHRLVREEGYRYKDFAIVTGDLMTYANEALPVFASYGIPLFIDRKQSILMNPAVELLRSALDMVVSSFSYETVFRFLRCGLTDFTNDEIDILENYCIALGIRGFSRYDEKWTRVYYGMDETLLLYINELRERFVDSVRDFAGALKEKSGNVTAYSAAVYQLLLSLHAEEKLNQRAVYYGNSGDIGKQKEYTQVFPKIIGLIDKLVEILGEETISLSSYQELLEAGLSEEKIALIPLTNDQVVLGDIERTRLKSIKILFFVGINDGVIPKEGRSGGIISDMDREYLKEQDVELAPSARDEMYMQRFYLYLSLTKPEERLILSYAKTGPGGENRLPSYLIGSIKRLFPELILRDISDEIYKPENLETKEEGIKYLAEGLKSLREDEEDEGFFDRNKEALTLFLAYRKQSEYRDKVDRLTHAAFYRNSDIAITKASAYAMYGTELVNSATRLELFAACAFAHFMQYGLRLSERKVYEFDMADIGTVLHRALEDFNKSLKENGKTLRDITEEEAGAFADSCVDDILSDYGNTVFHSSKRNEHMIRRIKRLLKRSVWALKQQLMAGDFKPEAFELPFTHEEKLALSDGKEFASLRISGRIDRIDLAESDGKLYVKIIDYKSGSTSLDLLELYYGLQLQLFLYLNAGLVEVERHHPGKQVEAAGVFYYRIKDPYIKVTEKVSSEAIEEKLLSELHPDGLVREESEIIRLMDHSLGAGERSKVIPVAYNKNGSLSKSSKTINKEAFDALSRYTKKAIKGIGQNILSGDIAASPYQIDKKKACTYCPYHSICAFDERIDGFRTRVIKKMSDEEILERIQSTDEGD